MSTDSSEGEFTLSNADFQRVRRLVKERSGIDLGEGKRALVYGRLARRLRQLGLRSFAEYLPLVEEGDEAVRFINALTTNVTDFFREAHHMEVLAEQVVPEAIARVRKHTGEPRRLRIWSAGCSTGEEPYSIAIALCELGAALDGWDVKILATDLDSDALATAAGGRYAADRVGKVGAARLGRWFTPLVSEGRRAGDGRRYQVIPEVRGLITFKQLNLLEHWPMRGPFDAIFCRNVIIYFDDPTKRALVRRYHDILRPEGYLFLGHSESLVGAGLGFVCDGRTVYRPCGPEVAS